MSFFILKNKGVDGLGFCANESNFNCKEYDPENRECLNNGVSSVIHVTIRSLSKHNDLVSLLNISGCQFDLIGCSETWLHDSSFIDILNLDGYKLFRKDIVGKQGGGVCLYVNSKLQAIVCDNVDFGPSDSLFIDLNLLNSNKLTVGIIYHPPDSNPNVFRGKLQETLFTLTQKSNNSILMADFNIDLSKDDATKHDFINTLNSFSYFSHDK